MISPRGSNTQISAILDLRVDLSWRFLGYDALHSIKMMIKKQYTAKLINFYNNLNDITFQELRFMVCMSYLLQVHRFMVIYIGLLTWSMISFISWLSLLVCCLLNKSYFMDGKTKMDFCCLQNTSSLYLRRFSRLVAVEPHVALSDMCAAVTIMCVCHFATEDSQKQKLHASDYLDTTLIL